MLRSTLFTGNPLLAAVERGQDRISTTQHTTDPAVTLLQTALLAWDPQALPAGHPLGTFDTETADAVRRFKLEEMGLSPGQIIDGVGRLTVQRLDEVMVAAEQPKPEPAAARTRRDAWSLAPQQPGDAWDPMLLAYAGAVAEMKQRPITDPTSWTFQAAIHGTHRAPQPGWGQCQHQGWYFLPWHRLYLYYFEQIVLATVKAQGGPADFALPYWNYERPGGAAMPVAYRVPTLPDGRPNPLYVGFPGRKREWELGGRVPTLSVNSVAAMREQQFVGPPGPGFGGGVTGPAFMAGATGSLENNPHNAIHRLVGTSGDPMGQCGAGLMNDPDCAALDPVFWLHHANIDRLWNRWLDPASGRSNPTASAWLDQTFTFWDADGNEKNPAVSLALDPLTNLGYRYDDDPPHRAAAAAAAASAPRSGRRPVRPRRPVPPTLGAATMAPVELTGQPASARLTAPASTAAMVRAAPQHSGRLYLHLDDIEADGDPGQVYAVYLNLPDDADDEQRRRHQVGVLSLFGLEQAGDPDRVPSGVPGFRHVFDVTEPVREIARESGWDPDQARVTFEPVGVLPPEGLAADIAPPGRAEAEPEEHAPIRVGRVGLFFGD